MEPFQTPRLRLRPLDGGDETLYRRIYSDPRVMRHVATPLSFAEAGSSFRIACRHNAASRGRAWWVCIEQAGGRPIGIVGTTRSDEAEGEIPEIEIGVMLLPAWQQRGFAAEAITGLIGRIAQRQPGAALRLRHAAGNAAMWRLARSLGFQVVTDDGAEVCWRWRGDPRPARRRGT